MGIKLELGGGRNAIGHGFVNVDQCEGADVRIDLEEVGRGERRLPFNDDSVERVFTSHCLEHVSPYQGVLRELARVCRLGAQVTIIVPHWNQSMAMCNGHKQTISERQVADWQEYPDEWWGNSAKRLALFATKHVPSRFFDEAREVFCSLSDEQLFRFIADTCHEVHFQLEVVSAGADERRRV